MDAPWIVMDSTLAKTVWDWQPTTNIEEIIDEIALFADSNPEWLTLTT